MTEDWGQNTDFSLPKACNEKVSKPEGLPELLL